MSVRVFTGLDSPEPEPPPKLEQVLRAEPITAWRIWRVVRPDTLTLTRGHLDAMGERWERGENPFKGLMGARLTAVAATQTWEHTCDAKCDPSMAPYAQSYYNIGSTPPAHEAPARHCNCGVWAVKDQETLWRALANYGANLTNVMFAYGTVQMWGRFYEHQLGFRAQYARPVSVTLIDSTTEVAWEIRDFYGCDVKCGGVPDEVTKLPRPPAAPASLSMQGPAKAWMHFIVNPGINWPPPVLPSPPDPTHGTPSTFRDSSVRWKKLYEQHKRATKDIAWTKGWFTP